MKIRCIFLVPAVLAVSAGGALAGGLQMQLASGSRLAAGAGSSVTAQPSGDVVADNGRQRKVCPAGSIALATTGKTTITTVRGTQTFPQGVAACLDPGDFGGKAAVSDDQGIRLKPVAAPENKQP